MRVQAVDPKHRKTLEELETLLSPQHNYRTYRALQTDKEKAHQPVIPILGLLLKDLLFINDGNKTKLDNGLVNFSKFRTMYAIVARLVGYQQTSYSVLMGRDLSAEKGEEVGVANEFCRTLRCLKEEVLYKYSCLCEAKVGADETLSSKWLKESKR